MNHTYLTLGSALSYFICITSYVIMQSVILIKLYYTIILYYIILWALYYIKLNNKLILL